MKKSGLALIGIIAAVSMLGLLGGNRVSSGKGDADRIVGAWFVTDAAAPFHYHMYVFNADGTMQQANPDAGDPNTSDSDGKGVWVSDGKKVKGKFVEITADRASHQFVSRGEISYEIIVNGDSFAGTAVARFYDINGGSVQGPINTSLAGKRVTLP